MSIIALLNGLEKRRAWSRRLLILSVTIITIGSVIPQGSIPSDVRVVSVGLDKIAHFMAFTCVILFALGAGEDLGFWHKMRTAIYILLFGVVIESVQYYIPYRTFNLLDILANLCGVLFGILLWNLGTSLKGKSYIRLKR